MTLEELDKFSSTWYQEKPRPRVYAMTAQRFTVERMHLVGADGKTDGVCYVLENKRFKIDVVAQHDLDFFAIRTTKKHGLTELTKAQQHCFSLG